MPIIYLHGLGFGLMQSHLLVKHLLKSLPSHPILIPLALHTSQSVFHERHLKPWSRREFVPAIRAICLKWGFWEEGKVGWKGRKGRGKGGVSLMSHSNGSTAHGWSESFLKGPSDTILMFVAVLKDCPELTRRNTFVDPVVFCLWEGGKLECPRQRPQLMVCRYLSCVLLPQTKKREHCTSKSEHDANWSSIGPRITLVLLYRV